MRLFRKTVEFALVDISQILLIIFLTNRNLHFLKCKKRRILIMPLKPDSLVMLGYGL